VVFCKKKLGKKKFYLINKKKMFFSTKGLRAFFCFISFKFDIPNLNKEEYLEYLDYQIPVTSTSTIRYPFIKKQERTL